MSFFFSRKFKLSLPKTPQTYLLIILAIFWLAVTAFVNSPLITTPKVDGHVFLEFPSATDYFKHMYTVTALVNYGLPPHHPYFPPSNYSYYYGYYLLPAGLSFLLPGYQSVIFYLYVLATGFVSLLCLILIIDRYLFRLVPAVLSFLIIIFGTGLDIFPTLIDNRSPGGRLIELWSISHNLGLRVDNTYTAFIWTPQHFLAAALSVLAAYLLLNGKRNLVILSLIFSYIFISSVFVFLGLCFLLAVIFLLHPASRKTIVLSAVTTLVIVLPLILSLSDRSGVFYTFKPGVFPFSSTFILNKVFTLGSEYGLIPFLLLFYLIAGHKVINWRWRLGAFLAIYIPIFSTWYIRSIDYNDYALRSILPLQLILPIVLLVFLIRSPYRRLNYLIYFLILVNLLGSSLGFLYEYSSRWKERGVIDIYTSEMLNKLRGWSGRPVIMALGRQEWIYKIPPLAYKPVLNSNFYDSAMYVSGLKPDEHGIYERLENNIFFQQTIDSGISASIDQKNSHLAQMSEFFSLYPFDFLLLETDSGIKQGKNPWSMLFRSAGVPVLSFTSKFELLSSQSLRDTFSRSVFWINKQPSQIIQLDNRHFALKPGIWFLVYCNNQQSTFAKLDLQDYFTLFEGTVPYQSCIGNLFFHPDDQPLFTGLQNTVNQLNAYPIEVKPIKMVSI